MNSPTQVAENESSTTLPSGEPINFSKQIVEAITQSLNNNPQNFKHSDLELCKNVFNSIQDIYDDLHNIVISIHETNGSLDIMHTDIPKIMLSISNIIKKYSTENNVFKSLTFSNNSPPNLLVIVEFIITSLIDCNIIIVPDNLKPAVKTLIKNSIDLLEMNLVLIEEIVEEEKKRFLDCLQKWLFPSRMKNTLPVVSEEKKPSGCFQRVFKKNKT